MKNLWIIANWKSNKTIKEALEWVDLVGPKLEERQNLKIVVCPSLSAIAAVSDLIKAQKYPLLVGAQNISPFGPGAFTGEVAASQLEGLVELSLIGHSERRDNFYEDDETVMNKVIEAKQSTLEPIVCIQDIHTPVPQGVKVVAYEPVFAIGTGNPDTPENASQVAQTLKNQNNSGLQVLYGGSVNVDNALSFLQQEYLDGLLIGGASLSAEEFVKIVEISYTV